MFAQGQVASVQGDRTRDRDRGVGRHVGGVGGLSDPQARYRGTEVEVLVIKRRRERGGMRFHHHPARPVRGVRETGAQGLVVQNVTTQRQGGASVGYGTARAATEARSPVLQHDSLGTPVKQDASRRGQDVLILQGDPVRTDSRSGNIYLPASQ